MDNITFTLTDVIYDAVNLYIGFTSNPIFKAHKDNYHFSFKINDHSLKGFGYSIDSKEINSEKGAHLLTLTPRNQLPDNIHLKMNIEKLPEQSQSNEVELSIKKISGVKSIPLSSDASFQGSKYKIEKILFTPFVTALIFSAVIPSRNNNNLRYSLINEHNIKLTPYGVSGGGGPEKDGKLQTRNIATFEPLEKIPKRLHFQIRKEQFKKNRSNKRIKTPLNKVK